MISAPPAAAALPDQLKVVTLALYPGRADDDHGGLMCTGTRTCEPVPYPYLERSVGADNLQTALQLDNPGWPVVVFGYSQGARVVGRWLEEHAGTEGAPSPDELSFVLIGNPDRKHGGAHVGHVTPHTEYDVIDVTRQYDRASDWPDNPLNLLAFLNACAGLTNIHIEYGDVDIYDPANYVWKEGNTTYVFIPTENIPLLEPLRKLGLTELADKLNDPLKAKIEKAYDRSYLPAQPGWPAKLEPEPQAPQQDPTPVESGSTTLTAGRTVRTSASDEPTIEQQSAPARDIDYSDSEFNAEKDRQAKANLLADVRTDGPADDDAAGDNSDKGTSDKGTSDKDPSNKDDIDTSDKQGGATSADGASSSASSNSSAAGQ